MRGVGARVFGAALKESYKKRVAAHTFNASMNLEAIRGLLLNGGNLPRIPTYSATFALEHAYRGYKTNVTYKYVDKSRFEAENETHTPGYNWVSALMSYENQSRYFDYLIYLKGENLTNEIAYNHLSFLKTTAPLPGRQMTAGLE